MWKILDRIRLDLTNKAAWCYESTSPTAILKVLATDGTAAMILYRLMQASGERGFVSLEMLFNKLNVVVGDCIIGRGAEIGEGLVIIHSQGIVINGQVKAGRNLHLEHQVTIGADRRRSPVLGDDVFIGAGAKVLGSVTIGDGARIGANAVVVHDVAPRTTEVGIPSRPVRRREDRERDAGANRSN